MVRLAAANPCEVLWTFYCKKRKSGIRGIRNAIVPLTHEGILRPMTQNIVRRHQTDGPQLSVPHRIAAAHPVEIHRRSPEQPVQPAGKHQVFGADPKKYARVGGICLVSGYRFLNQSLVIDDFDFLRLALLGEESL